MTPLRVGLALGGAAEASGWGRALALAERADAAGLHSVWLPEGHFRPGATASPLVGLAAFAARTRRLRVATTSLLLPIHHPLRAAAELATLDALSRGRLILGVGRGFQSPVFAGFGVASSKKRDRFDEALDAILDAWSGEPFLLDGDAFASLEEREVRLALRPVQRPHPPIVVAAFGRKGLLQAARRSLPYLASPLETLDTLVDNYATWREALPNGSEAVSRAGAAVPVMRTVFVAESDGEARRVLDALRAEAPRVGPKAPPALARAAEGRLEDRVLVGTPSQIDEKIAEYRERLGMDLLVARTEIAGTPQNARTRTLDHLATLQG